jgi:hypothetical protein
MNAAVTDMKAAWCRLAARLRATLSKVATWLRNALGKLSLRLRLALAALALWLAVQRFRIMPMSIDIGTKLRNPPPAEVRQLEPRQRPPGPSGAGEPRRTARCTPAPSRHRRRRQHRRARKILYLGRRNAASAADGRPPRMPISRPAARPTPRQGRATAALRNRHPERRQRNGHRPLDGLLTILTLPLRLFGLLRLFSPIRFRGRKGRSRSRK